jgi:hypothetical protein
VVAIIAALISTGGAVATGLIEGSRSASEQVRNDRLEVYGAFVDAQIVLTQAEDEFLEARHAVIAKERPGADLPGLAGQVDEAFVSFEKALEDVRFLGSEAASLPAARVLDSHRDLRVIVRSVTGVYKDSVPGPLPEVEAQGGVETPVGPPDSTYQYIDIARQEIDVSYNVFLRQVGTELGTR